MPTNNPDVRENSHDKPNVGVEPESLARPGCKCKPKRPLSESRGVAVQPEVRLSKQTSRLIDNSSTKAEIPCSLAQYDWSNFDLQLNHLGCCRSSLHQEKMLRNIYRRITYTKADGKPGYWNNQRKFRNYHKTASVIACSNYEKRWKFCQCGFGHYSCGDRLFCPLCCYNRLALPLIEEFKHCTKKVAACYFVVLSLSRHSDERRRLVFKDSNQKSVDRARLYGAFESSQHPDEASHFVGIRLTEIGDEELCQAYWRVYDEAIGQMTGPGKPFLGAYGGPELAVRFYPKSVVLPHANFIVFSNGLMEQDARELRRIIRDKLRGRQGFPQELYPTVSVQRIVDPKTPCASSEGVRFHLMPSEEGDPASSFSLEESGGGGSAGATDDATEYACKPIYLGDAFASAVNQIGQDESRLEQLTIDVDIFLEYVVKAFAGVHRIKRFGICNASSKGYCGYVTVRRKTKRRKDRKRRKKIQSKTRRIQKYFPDYRPATRKVNLKKIKMFWDMKQFYFSLISGRKTFLQVSRQLRKNYGRRVPCAAIRAQRPQEWVPRT